MSVFGNYARYYDLLYRDKDYAGETAYVAGLLRRHGMAGGDVLELGSGTGRHAALLAQEGYRVTGVDRSEEMLAAARRRAAERPELGLAFHLADVRDADLGRCFDAVISLFHVVCYQVTNADLDRMFATVRRHLRDGGLFVFDVWYGPCVLTVRPETRVLRLADDRIEVLRTAEPTLRPNENVVDVNFEIVIRDRATGVSESVRETHPMRYLFRPELEYMLGRAGLEVVLAEEWLTGREPGCQTWGVCFVARA